MVREDCVDTSLKVLEKYHFWGIIDEKILVIFTKKYMEFERENGSTGYALKSGKSGGGGRVRKLPHLVPPI